MATFQEALGDAARAAICTLAAEDSNVVGLLERTGLQNNPLAQAGRAFRLAYCSNDDPISTPPSYSGGQCPGTFYLVDASGVVEYFVNGGYQQTSMTWRSISQQNQGTAIGPIGSPTNLNITSGGSGNSIGVPLQISDGSNDGIFGLSPISNGGPPYNSQTTPNQRIISAQITSVQSIGGPDNCGNASDTIPPPANLPLVRPINITFNNNNNVVVTLDGSINVFAPVFSPILAPRIPVRFSLGGLTLTGNLNVDGTLDLGFDYTTGPGTDRENPEPPEGTPPEQDTVIIGARVSVLSDTGQTTTIIFNGSNPDIYIPRAGTIQFLQPAGDSLAWSGDIPIKTNPQWVPCGAPGYATRIAFTATPGVILKVTAVLGKPPTP